MKIHSSSLTLRQPSLNRQPIGKQTNARNKDENTIAPGIRTSDAGLNGQTSAQSSEQVKPITEISRLNNSPDDKAFAFSPRDSRVSKALTAYSQELNQLLVDPSSRAAQVIDTFV